MSLHFLFKLKEREKKGKKIIKRQRERKKEKIV